MGYAGGSKKNPTYRDLGDHSETVEIDFDPAKISYGELLDIFWKGHSPSRQSWSRQYAAVIFYHTDEQKRLAEETRDRIARERDITVATEILPSTGFSLAEDYHQKHALQRYPEFMKELAAVYPTMMEMITSTAAARLNGYLGGEGSYQDFDKEVDGLGLSPAGREELRRIVSRRTGSIACPVP